MGDELLCYLGPARRAARAFNDQLALDHVGAGLALQEAQQRGGVEEVHATSSAAAWSGVGRAEISFIATGRFAQPHDVSEVLTVTVRC